ncbi:hypothetical protein CCACVL1_27993 [Corchorus capsularis]|uniref:Uncharacterized protein n=1 Tax=Corchorus capsularis TaxID=210143 RepID=A0A1R3G7X2_COCAP|nr:hypothetical protein CCACVL1_27993 [Corchorus capsularis]
MAVTKKSDKEWNCGREAGTHNRVSRIFISTEEAMVHQVNR